MTYSMTGYGAGEAVSAGGRLTVELKSVNNRFLDFSIRLSRELSFLEPEARSRLAARIGRGKVDLRASFEASGESLLEASLDRQLLDSVLEKLHEIECRVGQSLNDKSAVAAQIPQVLTIHERAQDSATLQLLFGEALERALDGLLAMRQTEGQSLAADIRQAAQLLEEQVEAVRSRQEGFIERARERLLQRVQLLLGDDTPEFYDGQRVAAEISLLADRAAVDEETARLSSHLKQLRAILDEDGPQGKKLDFLAQEMLREVNTIGAKANDLIVTQSIIEMKTQVERIREQVQNVE